MKRRRLAKRKRRSLRRKGRRKRMQLLRKRRKNLRQRRWVEPRVLGVASLMILRCRLRRQLGTGC